MRSLDTRCDAPERGLTEAFVPVMSRVGLAELAQRNVVTDRCGIGEGRMACELL